MAGMIEQNMRPDAGLPPDQSMAMVPPTPGDAPGAIPMMDDTGEYDPEDDLPEADESDPNYQAAMQFVAEALYKNDAAQSIAAQLRASDDKVQVLADVAYDVVEVAAEKLDGALPEELYLPLAATVIEEVSDIAEAAGIEYQDADYAEALKRIVLRFLGEMGQDTTQLQAAFDQFSPELMNQLSQEVE